MKVSSSVLFMFGGDIKVAHHQSNVKMLVVRVVHHSSPKSVTILAIRIRIVQVFVRVIVVVRSHVFVWCIYALYQYFLSHDSKGESSVITFKNVNDFNISCGEGIFKQYYQAPLVTAIRIEKDWPVPQFFKLFFHFRTQSRIY